MDMHLNGVEKYQVARKKIFEISFNSMNKWQLSVHDLNDPNDPRYLMVMKVHIFFRNNEIFPGKNKTFLFYFHQGAPERIIDLCAWIRIGDQVFELNEEWKKTFNSVYEEIGGMGERVIGKYQRSFIFSKFPENFFKNPSYFARIL
jgi:sodium/potassium-transporting ATPase subunit alpha